MCVQTECACINIDKPWICGVCPFVVYTNVMWKCNLFMQWMNDCSCVTELWCMDMYRYVHLCINPDSRCVHQLWQALNIRGLYIYISMCKCKFICRHKRMCTNTLVYEYVHIFVCVCASKLSVHVSSLTCPAYTSIYVLYTYMCNCTDSNVHVHVWSCLNV